jgi:ABC-type multidrug transport system ATPase subunit
MLRVGFKRIISLIERGREQSLNLALSSLTSCKICYGKEEIEAMKGVNIDVSKGELFHLFGPNGAGKKSFLRIISTQLLASGGDVHVEGHSVMREAEDLDRGEENVFDQ